MPTRSLPSKLALLALHASRRSIITHSTRFRHARPPNTLTFTSPASRRVAPLQLPELSPRFVLARHQHTQPPSKPDPDSSSKSQKEEGRPTEPVTRDNIYTIPNALTLSRILACPVLGYAILDGDFYLATGLLTYAGLTDWIDGYLARTYNMRSVVGTILDPAADKALMTTLTITLAMKGLLPVPLAVLILGRDVLLSLWAFYIRYNTLPAPKTFTRYWDFSIPSAEVRPTEVSKWNTALQLLLMGTTTVSPVLGFDISLALQGLQWTVAGTTLWSGLSYLLAKEGYRVISQKEKPPSP